METIEDTKNGRQYDYFIMYCPICNFSINLFKMGFHKKSAKFKYIMWLHLLDKHDKKTLIKWGFSDICLRTFCEEFNSRQ
jgi:hypothetical protein